MIGNITEYEKPLEISQSYKVYYILFKLSTVIKINDISISRIIKWWWRRRYQLHERHQNYEKT